MLEIYRRKENCVYFGAHVRCPRVSYIFLELSGVTDHFLRKDEKMVLLKRTEGIKFLLGGKK